MHGELRYRRVCPKAGTHRVRYDQASTRQDDWQYRGKNRGARQQFGDVRATDALGQAGGCATAMAAKDVPRMEGTTPKAEVLRPGSTAPMKSRLRELTH